VIIFGWLVLGLVFLGEVFAIVAFAVWGWEHGDDWRWALSIGLAALTMVGWALFASPKATLARGHLRDILKIGILALATLALWDSGYESAAVAFAVFNLVVNAVAQLTPSIKVLAQP
jgi:hypothetical protein